MCRTTPRRGHPTISLGPCMLALRAHLCRAIPWSSGAWWGTAVLETGGCSAQPRSPQGGFRELFRWAHPESAGRWSPLMASPRLWPCGPGGRCLRRCPRAGDLIHPGPAMPMSNRRQIEFAGGQLPSKPLDSRGEPAASRREPARQLVEELSNEETLGWRGPSATCGAL